MSDHPTIRILFMNASPTDRARLSRDDEARAIQDRLQRAALRDQFNLRQHFAARVDDLQARLLDEKPHIVHFSGYNDAEGLVLQDDAGRSFLVSASALRRLFSILKDEIRVVVLNACFSEQQAAGIAESIDCVIGMASAIDDAAAITFAASFYRALAYGRSVREAFELGQNAIELGGSAGHDVPMLIARTGVDPGKVYLGVKDPAPPRPTVKSAPPQTSAAPPPSPAPQTSAAPTPSPAPQTSASGVRIVYVNAPQDLALLYELHKHLIVFKRNGQVASLWGEHMVQPGEDRETAINNAIDAADIILLLLSPDFVASDAAYDQMNRALERRGQGSTQVVPILVRHVAADDAPWENLQALPMNRAPISAWASADEAWLDVVRGLKNLIASRTSGSRPAR
jgi:hypothetical protein